MINSHEIVCTQMTMLERPTVEALRQSIYGDMGVSMLSHVKVALAYLACQIKTEIHCQDDDGHAFQREVRETPEILRQLSLTRDVNQTTIHNMSQPAPAPADPFSILPNNISPPTPADNLMLGLSEAQIHAQVNNLAFLWDGWMLGAERLYPIILTSPFCMRLDP
ncbi:hypothetical protein Hypma_008176 [Hypsizygus marmoreus]|uniref:Uncharacterized protein n=1 Tax=Hypsizygus marmoreus TaxID=39966 RepID=A0A369JWC3_HYPMA|nr:hypothetical protein Hypma_008176 [Hypsizygus marmoreus]